MIVHSDCALVNYHTKEILGQSNIVDNNHDATLVLEVFLDFSSFGKVANTSLEAARKKNLWLPWT